MRNGISQVRRIGGINAVGFILGIVTVASTAHAVAITPGQHLTPNGGGAISITATKIYDTGLQTLLGKNVSNVTVFTATVEAQVWKETGGTLDFVYDFVNSSGSQDSIERFTVAGYNGVTTNADFAGNTALFTPPSGFIDDPDEVDRQSANNGDTIGFNFDTVSGPDPNTYTVFPGDAGATLTIKTNVTSYGFNNAFLIDGGNGSVGVPAPIAIPEPVSGISLLLGVGVFGFRRRPRISC